MTQQPPAGTAQEQIRGIIAEAQEHQNDVERLMALHTDNVSIVNIAGRRIFGRESFKDAMTQALSSPLRDVRTTVDVDRVELVTDTVAIASCTKTVHDHRQAGDRARLPGSVGCLTYVVVRGDAGWLIASAQTTPIAGQR